MANIHNHVSTVSGIVHCRVKLRYMEQHKIKEKEYHITTTEAGVVFNFRNEIIADAADIEAITERIVPSKRCSWTAFDSVPKRNSGFVMINTPIIVKTRICMLGNVTTIRTINDDNEKQITDRKAIKNPNAGIRSGSDRGGGCFFDDNTTFCCPSTIIEV
ncbi:hypothetical protein QR98_0006840 [Sarcoptes scabiei]|uniref:Uncharacterized protein n=1 Tax=Sarcoptes scabiei TaxID=52283 RepID=A0A131ZVG8_SARSC|nr:hypothetical protein QR98_0006840 [Sarcoptes scabiei]